MSFRLQRRIDPLLFRGILDVPGVLWDDRTGAFYAGWDSAWAVARLLDVPEPPMPVLREEHLPGLARYHELGFPRIFREFAKEDLRFLARVPGGVLGEPPRAGKTLIAIALAILLDAKKVLEIGPAIAKWVWAGELAKWIEEPSVLLDGRGGRLIQEFCVACGGIGELPPPPGVDPTEDGGAPCPRCRARNGQSLGYRRFDVPKTCRVHGHPRPGDPERAKWRCAECLRDLRAALTASRWVVCFPKETQVETPTGSCAIGRLVPGDEVVVYTPGRRFAVRRVVASAVRRVRHVVHLTFASGRSRITATPEHPFLTADGTWIPSGRARGRPIACETDHHRSRSTECTRPVPVLGKGRQVAGYNDVLAVDCGASRDGLWLFSIPQADSEGSPVRLRDHEGNDPAHLRARPYLSQQEVREPRSPDTDNESRQHEAASPHGTVSDEDTLHLGAQVHAGDDLRHEFWTAVSDLQARARAQQPSNEALRGVRSAGAGTGAREEACGTAPEAASAEEIEYDVCASVIWEVGDFEVVNLEVEAPHTFVLTAGPIVHNCNFDIMTKHRVDVGGGIMVDREDLPGWIWELSRYPFDLVIIDEAQLGIGGVSDAARRKAIRALLDPARSPNMRVVVTTGTLFDGFVRNGYGALDIATGGLFGSPRAFVRRYADPKRTKYGLDINGRSIYADTELQNRLGVIKIQHPDDVVFAGTPPVQRQIQRLDVRGANGAIVDEDDLQADLVRQRRIIHQAVRETALLKMDAVLEEVIQELLVDRKTVVFCRYKSTARAFHQRLQEALRKGPRAAALRKKMAAAFLATGPRDADADAEGEAEAEAGASSDAEGDAEADVAETVKARFDLAARFRTYPAPVCMTCTYHSMQVSLSLLPEGQPVVVVHELEWCEPGKAVQAEKRPYGPGVHLIIRSYSARHTIDEHQELVILPQVETVWRMNLDATAGGLAAALALPTEDRTLENVWERLTRHVRKRAVAGAEHADV